MPVPSVTPKPKGRHSTAYGTAPAFSILRRKRLRAGVPKTKLAHEVFVVSVHSAYIPVERALLHYLISYIIVSIVPGAAGEACFQVVQRNCVH